ncbi:class I SAM-dependent methyltransferase [Methylomonas albis]|uniref:Class I SAM-dependent methyltransferase n=1 Tax=Methylomonas albis TaxID=1854563 RepID=A0ABR9D5K6_9GAMM|nr:class I SAM-dependent methyltransferase [Methylomonas albis]MBD9358412.1 class I SAM-dependent methyltransferase [Methylomonas albis]
MTPKDHVHRLKNKIDLLILNLRDPHRERFECPLCGYDGPFLDIIGSTGPRKHAKCPNCNSGERQRIQFLVVNDVLKQINSGNLKMLHFAPESFFRDFFSKRFGQYETADLNMKGVDHNVDLQQLPFDDHTYDFVFASHVLEHVPDDEKAISEIYRILKPNGIAILPVPIVAEKTIEYPEPNPEEDYHVRAPGFDYFKRYERYFSKVDAISSDSLPSKYQLFIYEDREGWPTKDCPLRLSMLGEKHIDIVPVCYV